MSPKSERPPSGGAAPRIYRAITCNFCHRAEISLHRKGVAYEAIDIDLIERPAWYREMSSGGSVPLFECEGQEIHPSGVMNEFIEERWPDPPMMPANPAARADARRFIHWWDDGPCPAYERRLMNVRPERDDSLTEALEASLDELERRLEAQGYAGAYWGGDTLELPDATAAPMFVRFLGLQHFHGIDVPERCERVRTWRDVLLADPDVAATRPDDAELLGEYERYLAVLSKAAAAGIEVPVTSRD